MTKRPAPKSMTLVTYYDIASRKIQFYADKYVVGDLEEYGVFLSSLDGYVLRVDPRYDFNEVLWYVRNYGGAGAIAATRNALRLERCTREGAFYGNRPKWGRLGIRKKSETWKKLMVYCWWRYLAHIRAIIKLERLP